jgi:hypothetical protein
MSRAKATQVDPAAGVVPAPQAAAPWRVVRVEPKPRMRLLVEFVDGTAGEAHLEAFLASARVTGTVFEQLRDPAFFTQVRVELGAVTWPNGADLAPDALYDAIRAHGSWTAGA